MEKITYDDLKTWKNSFSWENFRKEHQEKALWLQMVMKKVGKAFITKKFTFTFLGDGMCDAVTSAVLSETSIQRVPYKFKWIGVKRELTNHFILLDLDTDLLIDLTAIQFKPLIGEPCQALVFYRSEFEKLGYSDHPDQVRCEKVIRASMQEYLSKI